MALVKRESPNAPRNIERIFTGSSWKYLTEIPILIIKAISK